VVEVARVALMNCEGDLVEIGAHVGRTTIRLLELAEQYDRRVLVVDPWEKGTQNCRGHERSKFLERTERLAHRLDVVRAESESMEAIAALIDRRPLALALVDGLHVYRAAKNDIYATMNASIVCVDDLDMPEVLQAYREVAGEKELCIVRDERLREGYLV
jgi:hypothetical protein